MRAIEVYKSGGTSTGTADGYRNLADLTRARVKEGKRVILVASAPATAQYRATELLRGYHENADNYLALEGAFQSIAVPLGIPFQRHQFMRSLFDAKTLDETLAVGEHTNAQLLQQYFKSVGIDAQWVDARRAIVTDSNFGGGRVLRVRTELFENGWDVYVVGGFHGGNEQGQTVIFPRGGSDITADRIAAALDAERNVNLKEVPGIYAADPRLLDCQPEQIAEITFREIRELAYAGNRVLQEDAMSWCRQKGIPIHVLSLQYPDNKGTIIVRSRDITQQPIAGIAAKKGFIRYVLDTTDSPSFLTDVFEAFRMERLSVDMIATENGHVSITLSPEASPTDTLDERLRALSHHVRRSSEEAMVSIVGEGITRPLTLRNYLVQTLKRNNLEVRDSYGPILGGVQTDMTIFYIEKFGMNGERGFAHRLFDIFAQHEVPVKGVSTTIDSVSIGTVNDDKTQRLCAALIAELEPDSVTVTRNGIQRYGPRSDVSNITLAVKDNDRQQVVRVLYNELFAQ